MSGPKDWPEGWSRDPGDRGRGGSDATPPGSCPLADRDPGQPPAPPPHRRAGTDAPPPTAPRRGDHATAAVRPTPPPGRRRRGCARPALLLLLVALLLGMFLYFYSRIEKVDAVQDYEGRPRTARARTG